MEPSPTDRRAFEALVVRHQDAVCAMAYSVLRDRARSEEIAQEAFLIAWQRLPALAITPAWICGVARNLARNAARRRTEVAMTDDAAGPDADPREALAALIRHETEARAAAALAALAARDRDAVVLYYRGDESMAQVAEALGVSLDAAKQRVHRARARLRAALAPVEATLRATRPGPAFTAAVVGAWLVRPAPASASASAGAGGGAALRWPLLAAGAVAVPAAIVAAIAVGPWRAAPAPPRSAVGATAAVVGPRAASAARAPAHVTARFPAAPRPRRGPPRGTRALAGPDPRAVAAAPRTVSFDFADAPAPALLQLLAGALDAPMLIDPSLDAPINVLAHDRPALELLDEILAQAGAEREEVAAVRLVTAGGQRDAAALGGDPVSIHLRAAPLDDVLAMLEVPLHMPIGRVELPTATVTLDVDELSAGAALEQVLAQASLGYELTTGFIVTPLPE